ncbi:protein SODIUM POTASSIUM ROOT DEFECTIVE 2-like [Prosopis cineraria]|uniref:protein SODIUM POTASSIUM ROOT DEFECTIVE 2-like n=1 Tax=Prosopis cineraria TaxID=364024 RepID=UPI0024108F17|nr:protein SODIUM POTASSIUM ROOT DEFECTIVE 2-like [Prosopis cineraria]
MKGIEIFCSSQASTAICVSMDEASSSSSTSKSVQLGGRAIDRHNPIIRDSRRAPCASPSSLSLPPKDPKPCEQPQKAKKNSSSKPRDENRRNSRKSHDQRKKSAAGRLTEHITNTYTSKPIESIVRRSWVRPPPDLIITPPGSSRYLLTETSVLDGLSNYDPVLALTPFDDANQKAQSAGQDETNHASKPSTSSLSRPASSDQVVVLRVSLHCRGCEGKLRKHLSRMEGVSSFNIDFAAKKVTIVGDVTPLSVLASVSKVKNAQFWPVPATPTASGTAETRK